MSRSEMIEAFVNGRMSRKDFIRGLVASGIAVSGAAAHAAALSPAAHAQEEDDFYALTSKEQCMDGGFRAFGFRNQGQCIRYVNTGKNSALEDNSSDEDNGVEEDNGAEQESGKRDQPVRIPRGASPRPV